MAVHLTRRINAFAYSCDWLSIHIIDIVGKSKQVILYHTHHTGGVTDLEGKSKQVFKAHTHLLGAVTYIMDLVKQFVLYHTYRCLPKE